MTKLTTEFLESKIVNESYHHFAGTTVTVCCLTLENGYNAIAESACIDLDDFDADIGKQQARNKAFSKLWELYGFAVKQSQLYDDDQTIEFANLIVDWHKDKLSQLEQLCTSDKIPSIRVKNSKDEDQLVIDDPEQIKFIQIGAYIAQRLIKNLPFTLNRN